MAAGFTEEQAEAVADGWRQAREFDLAQLATKADLGLAPQELLGEIAAVRAQMQKMRGDLLDRMIVVAGVQTLLIIRSVAGINLAALRWGQP